MNRQIFPSLEQFKELAKQGNVIPVYAVQFADLSTPLSLFCRLPHGNNAFLLETIEGEYPWSRYSLMGIGSKFTVKRRGAEITVWKDGEEIRKHCENPDAELAAIAAELKKVDNPKLPAVHSGFVGYFAFESGCRVDDGVQSGAESEDFDQPDAFLMFADNVFILDRFYGKLFIVHNVRLKEGDDLDAAYAEAAKRVESLVSYANGELHDEYLWQIASATEWSLHANLEKDEFCAAAEKALDKIKKGDLQSAVLSLRFFSKLYLTSMNMYRALKYIRPEPYGFYLKFGSLEIMGMAKEALLRMDEKGAGCVYNVAGERFRPMDAAESCEMKREMQNDIDMTMYLQTLAGQAVDDVDEVAARGSIKAEEPEAEQTIRFLRMQSRVAFKLAKNKTAFDAISRVVPGAAMSGAPKRAALRFLKQVVDKERRGPSGGVFGYVGLGGNVDLVSACSTVTANKGRVHIQVTAPITRNSDPERAYEKARAEAECIFDALKSAAKGIDEIIISKE